MQIFFKLIKIIEQHDPYHPANLAKDLLLRIERQHQTCETLSYSSAAIEALRTKSLLSFLQNAGAMLINDQKHIADIQADFRRMFPYLKLEFYSLQHETGKGSPKKAILPAHKLLSEVRTVHSEGDLIVQPAMTVNELENKFFELFGLNAQVFRRSGNLWMQTTVTDSWTLAEQNRKGGASEAFFEEMHNTEQKPEADSLDED